MLKDSQQRFTHRVSDYVKARPSYPASLIDILMQHCGLTTQSWIGDIGSGTGLLAEVFLNNGNPVYGVEPNAAMRQAGESYLQRYEQFISVTGSAENTTLADQSCDFVTAGQAFHWFDLVLTRTEFQRILKPQGWVALIWNVISQTDAGFYGEYENLFQHYGTDESGRKNKHVDVDKIQGFFLGQPVQQITFAHPCELNLSDFQSRVFSSSFAPEPDSQNYLKMLHTVKALFQKHQKQDILVMPYETRIYLGNLSE